MAKVSHNPADVEFHEAAFYNLGKLRKDMLALIVRSTADKDKVKAVNETLKTLKGFMDARIASDAKEVEAFAAAKAAAAEKAEADAKAERIALAEFELAASETRAAEARAVLIAEQGEGVEW